jgi:hypothetical protein
MVAAHGYRNAFMLPTINHRGIMRRAVSAFIAAAFTAAASHAQYAIPVRTLAPAAATTSEPLASYSGSGI